MQKYIKLLSAATLIAAGLWLLQTAVLMPFICAIFLAKLLHPVVERAQDYFGVSYKLCATIVFVLFWIVVAAVFWQIGFSIYIQISKMVTTGVDYGLIFAFAGKIQQIANQLLPQSKLSVISQWLITTAPTLLTEILQSATVIISSFAASLPNFLVGFVIFLIASYFTVTDYKTISDFFQNTLPTSVASHITAGSKIFFSTIQKLLMAQFLLVSFSFVTITTGLALLGVKYFLALGFLIALLDILPVVGMGLVLLPWGIACIMLGTTAQGVGILILYGISIVTRSILEPKILGERLGLHPLATLVSIYVGITLFGFWGAVFLPVVVAISLQVYRGYWARSLPS